MLSTAAPEGEPQGYSDTPQLSVEGSGTGKQAGKYFDFFQELPADILGEVRRACRADGAHSD